MEVMELIDSKKAWRGEGKRKTAVAVDERPIKVSWVKRWKRNLGKKMMAKESDRVYLPYYIRLLDILKGA